MIIFTSVGVITCVGNYRPLSNKIGESISQMSVFQTVSISAGNGVQTQQEPNKPFDSCLPLSSLWRRGQGGCKDPPQSDLSDLQCFQHIYELKSWRDRPAITWGSQMNFENQSDLLNHFHFHLLVEMPILAFVEMTWVCSCEQSSCAGQLLTGTQLHSFQQHKLHSQPVASEDYRSVSNWSIHG